MSVRLTCGALQVLREDKLLIGCQRYIGETLGGAFTQGQPWTLEGVLPDTTALRPIIFILTSGADPTAMLQVFIPSCTSYAHTCTQTGIYGEPMPQQYIYILACFVCMCLFCVSSVVPFCASRTYA